MSCRTPWAEPRCYYTGFSVMMAKLREKRQQYANHSCDCVTHLRFALPLLSSSTVLCVAVSARVMLMSGRVVFLLHCMHSNVSIY